MFCTSEGKPVIQVHGMFLWCDKVYHFKLITDWNDFPLFCVKMPRTHYGEKVSKEVCKNNSPQKKL